MGREDLSFEVEEALETIENDLVIPDQGDDHAPLLAKIYDLPDRVIEDLSKKYTPLRIAGAVDKQGRLVVHNALMDVKGYITAIDKTRKKTNEKAQAWISANNGEAKRLVAKLDPIREHLQAERDKHDKEVEEIKAAKQRELDLRNQDRMEKLLAVEDKIGLAAVVTMDDQAFTNYLEIVTKAYNDRKAYEAQQAAEAAAKAQAEAEAKAKADKEAAEKLEADRVANAAAKAENDRVAAELKAKMDKFEAEQAQAAQVAQTKAKAQAIEAAKPDAEKLLNLATEIDSMVLPAMATESGKAALTSIKTLQDKMVVFIRSKSADLTK